MAQLKGNTEIDTLVVSMVGTIYCGDNLKILSEYIPHNSIDLIYLDPPFNSQRTYNLAYKDQRAQEVAFKDFWPWEEAASMYHRMTTLCDISESVVVLLKALNSVLGTTNLNQLAYLTMMTPRLVALHKVLKPTGSLYLHCDPTSSHYLKMILDTIFGAQNFFSEIVWKRYGAHGDAKRYGAVHDTLLFYGKTQVATFNKQFVPYTDSYTEKVFRFTDKDGRRYQAQNLSSPNPRPNLTYPYQASNGVTYQPHRNGWKCDLERMKLLDNEGRLHFPKNRNGRLRLKMFLDECQGVPIQDLWTDILLPSTSKERLGYPTQKPLDLLKRIISASSNPGDIVLDPFCGSGTTIEAAEVLRRRWIGIDLAQKAVEFTKNRLKNLGIVQPKTCYPTFVDK